MSEHPDLSFLISLKMFLIFIGGNCTTWPCNKSVVTKKPMNSIINGPYRCIHIVDYDITTQLLKVRSYNMQCCSPEMGMLPEPPTIHLLYNYQMNNMYTCDITALQYVYM